jgi:DNA-binding NarL/FixJ family response regulator
VPAPGAARAIGLTPRQRDVLALLVAGKSNKQICRELDLAEGTVKGHIAAIFRALEVTTRVQAVVAAGKLGIKS